MNIALRRFLHNHGNIATDNGNNGETLFSQILEYNKLLTMLLITEHYYHAMGQTLPSTDYPTYKIHCMIFVSPLCQSCNHLKFRDWLVSVLRDGA